MRPFHSKSIRRVVTGVAIGVAVFHVMLFGAVKGFALQVDQTWDDGAIGDWSSSSLLTRLTSADEFLNVEFARQSRSLPLSATIKTTVSEIVPTMISFRFRAADAPPSALRLYIHSSSGRSWYVPLHVKETGEWQEFSVPVALCAGWVMGPASDSARFIDDVTNIDWVGIYVSKHGSISSQNYGIDDFLVEGEVAGGEAPQLVDGDLDGMENAWEDAHGLNSGDATDADLDADGDRLSNVEEFIAGTDPNDSASAFRVTFGAVQGTDRKESGDTDGFVVQWNSVSNRAYCVWYSPTLGEEFHCVASDLGSTPPINKYVDGEERAETGFYRVSVRLPD